MLNFTKDFPNAALINMSTNYRSLKNIIHDADLLIKQNQVRFAKDFIGFREADGCVKYINYKDNTPKNNTSNNPPTKKDEIFKSSKKYHKRKLNIKSIYINNKK